MTQTKVIKVGNREWIAGLAWRSFADKPSLAERRDDAKELGADWVALRNTSQVIQAGFCKAVERRNPRRLYSLAAAIAESQRQPWLGTFRLSDDVWWYIAVRDGQSVLPGGDVVGDYDTVMEARQGHESSDDWNIQDGTLEDLTPILTAASSADELVRLRSVEPISPWRIIAPALGVLLVVGGGVWLWHRHVEAEQRERAAALRAERARLLAEQKAISPLKTTPSPDRWLAACEAVIGRLPLTESGWSLSGVSCGGSSASVKWKRLPLATVAQRPVGALSRDGNSVTENIGLGALKHGMDDAHGLTAGDDALFELLQPIGVQARISAPPSKPTLPGARSSHKPPPIPSQSVSFKLPIAPFDIAFDEVPGLRLDFVKRGKDGWTIQGMIYGR